MATLSSRMVGTAPAARRRPVLDPRLLFERPSSLGLLLMVPGGLLLLVFMAYPFFLGIWLSMTDSRIGMPGAFIGRPSSQR